MNNSNPGPSGSRGLATRGKILLCRKCTHVSFRVVSVSLILKLAEVFIIVGRILTGMTNNRIPYKLRPDGAMRKPECWLAEKRSSCSGKPDS